MENITLGVLNELVLLFDLAGIPAILLPEATGAVCGLARLVLEVPDALLGHVRDLIREFPLEVGHGIQNLS